MHALRELYRYRVYEYESFSIYERPALSCTTQERLKESGGCLQWARDVNLLKEGVLRLCSLHVRNDILWGKPPHPARAGWAGTSPVLVNTGDYGYIGSPL